MAIAPSPLRDAYFSNLYFTIPAEAENHLKVVELQARELGVKERSLKLHKAFNNVIDSLKMNTITSTQVQCTDNKSFDANSLCASPKSITC